MSPAELERLKDLLPVDVGSDDVRREFAADILRRSVFSAHMEDLRYLAQVRDVCADVVDGKINQAAARERLLRCLDGMGHSPRDEGGLANPASQRRLDLIIDTQRQMAASAAQLASETEASLEEWPAVELTRFVGRAAPRPDWHRRWEAAGAACGWRGALKSAGEWPDWRMVALKGSPIWQALGAGAGGFRDTLGNPFPPFAYGSGLAWADVSRDEAIALGLIAPDATVPVPESPDLSPSQADIASAAERLGFSGNWLASLIG